MQLDNVMAGFFYSRSLVQLPFLYAWKEAVGILALVVIIVMNPNGRLPYEAVDADRSGCARLCSGRSGTEAEKSDE